MAEIYPTPSSPSQFCDHCRAPLPADSQFCPKCGTRVLTRPAVTSPPIKSPVKKRSSHLIGIVVAGTLLLMLACLGFAINSGGKINAAKTATALALGGAVASETTSEATPIAIADALGQAPEPTTVPAATEAPEPTDKPEPTATPEPTSTDAPTNTPAPPTETPIPPTPTEAPTATLPPEPIVITGEGAVVTDPIEIPRGVYRLNLSHTGQSNFIVHSFDPEGEEDSVSNKIGPYEGMELLVSDGGTWTFEVNADGAWTINPEPIGLDDSLAGGIEGRGDVVTDLFSPPREGPVPYEFMHDGESNFIVHLECAGGSDSAQNEIGPVSGSAMARFSAGPCLWDVNADGNWSIKPR